MNSRPRVVPSCGSSSRQLRSQQVFRHHVTELQRAHGLLVDETREDVLALPGAFEGRGERFTDPWHGCRRGEGDAEVVRGPGFPDQVRRDAGQCGVVARRRSYVKYM